MSRKETITFDCNRCGDKETYNADDDPEPEGWTEITEGRVYCTEVEDIDLEGEMWCKLCTKEFLQWRKEKPARTQQLHG